jgi:hypothetical protein
MQWEVVARNPATLGRIPGKSQDLLPEQVLT